MANINQINVNGTDYDIVTAGTEVPLIVELGVAASEGLDFVHDHTGEYYSDDAISDENILFYLKRTGESGSYQYSLVALLNPNIISNSTFSPIRPNAE